MCERTRDSARSYCGNRSACSNRRTQGPHGLHAFPSPTSLLQQINRLNPVDGRNMQLTTRSKLPRPVALSPASLVPRVHFACRRRSPRRSCSASSARGALDYSSRRAEIEIRRRRIWYDSPRCCLISTDITDGHLLLAALNCNAAAMLSIWIIELQPGDHCRCDTECGGQTVVRAPPRRSTPPPVRHIVADCSMSSLIAVPRRPTLNYRCLIAVPTLSTSNYRYPIGVTGWRS